MGGVQMLEAHAGYSRENDAHYMIELVWPLEIKSLDKSSSSQSAWHSNPRAISRLDTFLLYYFRLKHHGAP